MRSLIARVTRGHTERGQALIIVALGMVTIVAMVGLVIDGGYAWGQQRHTQNGADAMALAGATVLAQNLAGTFPAKTDGDVGCAVEASAAANGVVDQGAVYTDISGHPLNPPVSVGPCRAGQGGLVPSAAAGVRANGERTFNTFLAGVIGFDTLTARAPATAVTGLLASVCPADAGCGMLPVTFPQTAVICDGTNQQIEIGSPKWPIVQATDATAPNYATTANEVIVPLCSIGPGSVGWLDLNCGTLKQAVDGPCNSAINIPSWLATQTGNVNSLEDAINAYAGPLLGIPDDTVLTIPLHDNTCVDKPEDDDTSCQPLGEEGSGQGNNFYYHVPKFVGFMMDRAYISGTNTAECNADPGLPKVLGNGATGCFKGWFVREVLLGPVVSGGTGPQDDAIIGIQLIS
jgi:hypothetical protein